MFAVIAFLPEELRECLCSITLCPYILIMVSALNISLISVENQVPNLVPKVQNLLYGMEYPFGRLSCSGCAHSWCLVSLLTGREGGTEKLWTQGTH